MLARMSVLPDPAELDALAGRIERHAATARDRASGLAAAVAAARWRGLAADACDLQVHVLVAALRSAADRLEGAAAALRRHAAKVRAIVADVAALGQDGAHVLHDLVHDPGALVGDVAHLAGDGIDLVDDALSMVGL